MENISKEEFRTGLRKMKKGKAQGPDDIPVEAWIALGNKGVEFLVKFFNRFLRGEKMPDQWRRSVLYKKSGTFVQSRKRHQRMWKLTGDQVDEPHYETVGEGNGSKDKEGGDDRLVTIWVHARKEYHRRNLLSEDAVGKVD